MTLSTARRHLRDASPSGMNAVLAAAAARGWRPGHPDWINLGQGQPEIGDLPGAPPRVTSITLDPGDHAYGPVGGLPETRAAVAAHYNRLYRRGRASQYTADNVSITAGGRLALNRVVAALGVGDRRLEIGYTLPDYAAYQDILERNTPRLRPVPGADPETLDVCLMSNPRNPTGEVIAGDALAGLVGRFARARATLIVDEFYSHYVYAPRDGSDGDGGGFGPAPGPVSAAAHVGDVDADPVLIIDGLTKNFRYPGWRLGWVVGPADVIAAIARVGQDLDGGPPTVTQRAALAALAPAAADQETSATRAAFARKRGLAVAGLRAAGIRVDPEPRGTFYVWGDLAGLPPRWRDADRFFHAALRARVIVVPGRAFDLHPGASGGSGAFDARIRVSYGPPEATVVEGLRRLAAMTGR